MRTVGEMIEAARRQLREDGEFSIRSVSAEIGLSSQGMYRYVESVDEMRALVADKVLDSMLGYMGAAADRYTQPARRIAASAVAFRTWSLANPHEFRHVFTTSSNIPMPPGMLTSAQRVGAFFAPLFAQLRDETGFRGPAHLDPRYTELAREKLTQLPYIELTGGDDAGVLWVFQYVWSRLYGFVAMEAFRQVDEEAITSGLFFQVTLAEVADRLAIRSEQLLEEVFAAEREFRGEVGVGPTAGDRVGP